MQLQESLPAFMAWFVVRQRGADAARGRQQEMARSSNTCTHDCSACPLIRIPSSRLINSRDSKVGKQKRMGHRTGEVGGELVFAVSTWERMREREADGQRERGRREKE